MWHDDAGWARHYEAASMTGWRMRAAAQQRNATHRPGGLVWDWIGSARSPKSSLQRQSQNSQGLVHGRLPHNLLSTLHQDPSMILHSLPPSSPSSSQANSLTLDAWRRKKRVERLQTETVQHGPSHPTNRPTRERQRRGGRSSCA